MFGCRTHPRVADLAPDGRLARFAAAAAPLVRGIETRTVRPDCQVLKSLGVELAPLEWDAAGVVFAAKSADTSDVFPLAIFVFHDRYADPVFEGNDLGELHAILLAPVAVQGLVVALLEPENLVAEHPRTLQDPNIDAEHVGLVGYAHRPSVANAAAAPPADSPAADTA